MSYNALKYILAFVFLGGMMGKEGPNYYLIIKFYLFYGTEDYFSKTVLRNVSSYEQSLRFLVV